jgi:hypothetical protein
MWNVQVPFETNEGRGLRESQLAGPSPLVHRSAAHVLGPGVHTRSVESQRAEAAIVLLLTEEERQALARILRVVEDNWWLDEVERALLERLEASDAEVVLSAA